MRAQTTIDKCGTLPIAVYTNEARQDQSTVPLIFQEGRQSLASAIEVANSPEQISESLSDETSYETDSEDECSEKENDHEIVFTHMPSHVTRSGRCVKAVSRLDL